MNKLLLLTSSLALVWLTGCTTQEKQILNDLNNLPGITCDINDQGVQHCGPDNPATITDRN